MEGKDCTPNDHAGIRSEAGEKSLPSHQDAKAQSPVPPDTFFTLLQNLFEEALSSFQNSMKGL